MSFPIVHRPTTLPDNFQFSQNSLQAYVDCPRLFQLRYVERLFWPAPEVASSLDNERYMQLGTSFHHLVQQYFHGVNVDRLETIAMQDTLLYQWWQSFMEHKPALKDYAQLAEFTISAPIDKYRLIAKFDLLVYKQISSINRASTSSIQANTTDPIPTDYMILDWKTSREMPKQQWLADRLQTRVYPYLLAKAGILERDTPPVLPDQITMVYWFSNFPTTPYKFIYSQEQFTQDQSYFLDLIGEIKKIGTAEAPKTENLKRCQYCVYRSLCNRGIGAGLIPEFQEYIFSEELAGEQVLDLDFEQIAEIEF